MAPLGASHGHSHAHGHTHGRARASARHKRRLLIGFGLIATFTVVEVVVGLSTDSLAVLSDAGHMLTDVLGLGMALAAIHLADRTEARDHRTFGLYRLEILAALANAALLFGVAAYVLIEAVGRFDQPPAIGGVPVMAIAATGLAVNLATFALLREGARESLNVQGAYLEVIADTLGSVGVLAAGVALAVWDWGYVDPIVGVGIGLFIVPRTWRLAAQAVRVLVQAAPPGIDLRGMAGALGAVPGVVDVHDLHVWTLTSEMEVATAHLMIGAAADPHAVLDEARHLLHRDFGIDHATLQVEPDTHQGCQEVAW